MPKFNKGDRVRVRLVSHSPYRDQIGVVDEDPSRYSSPSKCSSGFWYMVRFEWKGLHPAARFMEEDLEAVADGLNGKELKGRRLIVNEARSRSESGRGVGRSSRAIEVVGSVLGKWPLLVIIGALVLVFGLVFLFRANSQTKSSSTGFGSTPIATTPGEATKLEFLAQPDGATSGLPFSTQPVVAVQDAEGKTVTGYSAPVTLVIADQTGTNSAKLSGTDTVNAVNGIATFKDISIKVADSDYMLTAISGRLESAISSSFAVTPGTPEKLTFITEPIGDGAGSYFSTQPEVAIQ